MEELIRKTVMANLFEKSMKKSEIMERVGDISQLCDARKATYTEGKASGVQIIEVTTGSGLAFTVLPSKRARYFTCFI